MDSVTLPPLDLKTWQPTRDTLHTYSKLLGQIRRALTPFQENWWHISLHAGRTGPVTPPIPTPEQKTFSVGLNLVEHALVISLPGEGEGRRPLQNQSPRLLCNWTLDVLNKAGIEPQIDRSLFNDARIFPYVPSHAETYRAALDGVNRVFEHFKSTLAGKTSPVQLWPHHFDLSVVWFSGREAVVPEGEEGGQEQIGFGFSTGDEGIPEAYFYANPWPVPKGVLDVPLPGEAVWHTTGWTGGLLRYNALARSPEPAAVLLNFLETVHRRSVALMK